jgi:beta-N-acetylhexosaminidase
MKITPIIVFQIVFAFYGCGQNNPKKSIEKSKQENPLKIENIKFELTDYLSDNKELDAAVNRIFNAMDDTAKVAQLVMPAVGRLGQTKQTIEKHIHSRIIGGVLMLNGTREEFTAWIKDFESLNKKKGNLPFLYSADAEPSLINRKITGSTPVKKAGEITNEKEVIEVAQIISDELKAIGINYNFAPVVDFAPNKTVGYRGFGANPENLIPWSNKFIEVSQTNNILATAKHFPGHGLVSGDTHKALQVIDGDLKEIDTYPPLIENGVLSVMVAHIAVQNNPLYDTKGLPSTCSENIVHGLLREKMGFKGLIVTDAMNMGGVVTVPQSAAKAIGAGCDIVLMPVDATKAHSDILNAYRTDKKYQQRADESIKRVIRMKLALGLLNE